MSDFAGRLNHRLVARARRISRVAGDLVMLIGLLALAGWLLDVAVLIAPYGGITMKANTALSLLLAGTSLRLLSKRHRDGPRRVGQAFAVLVGAIGVATLSQHVFGWDLGIDQLLFTEEPGAAGTASPGRMGPPASTSFAIAGVVLLLLHAGFAGTVAQLGAVAIGLIALLGITGYAYHVDALYGVARFTGVALHTSVALLILSLGMMASAPDRGLASILVGDGAGSVMATRLLGFAVVVPMVLGWVRLRLQDAGYFATEFGVAVLILGIIAVLAALIARTAVRVNQIDQQRFAAEATLRDRLQEIETMMEVLPIGVFIARDRAGSQIAGNQAAREILRVPEPRENLSLSAPSAEAPQHFRVFRSGEEVPPQELPVQRAARDGTASHEQDLEVRFADGEIRHVQVTALPLRDGRGNPRGAVASFIDVTEQKAAEREREELLAREREARGQAEAANRAKDEFLATVSHELRTPLNAILGWVALLREGAVTDEQAIQRALATIERNCRTQAQLIEDLLDVSRMVAGSFRLDLEPVDLVPIVTAAAEVVRPVAGARGVELCLRLASGPVLVRGDATRLQQVVWNLLANAAKFSARGDEVDVVLTTDDSAAKLTVTDHGEGIAPEFLPYIFDRFRQADSTKSRHGGLGLGLAITRHLVEMHGGTVEASSDGVGRGASFTVRLPRLGSGRSGNGDAWPGAGTVPAVGREPLRGLRILAIDDEADARGLIRTLLERQGAEVEIAAAVPEALDTVVDWRPHVILFDIGIPEEDGYELIRGLRLLERESPSTTPVIALTGYVSEDERRRALDAGYDAILAKPVDVAKLVTAIQRLIGGGRGIPAATPPEGA